MSSCLDRSPFLQNLNEAGVNLIGFIGFSYNGGSMVSFPLLVLGQDNFGVYIGMVLSFSCNDT